MEDDILATDIIEAAEPVEALDAELLRELEAIRNMPSADQMYILQRLNYNTLHYAGLREYQLHLLSDSDCVLRKESGDHGASHCEPKCHGATDEPQASESEVRASWILLGAYAVMSTNEKEGEKEGEGSRVCWMWPWNMQLNEEDQRLVAAMKGLPIEERFLHQSFSSLNPMLISMIFALATDRLGLDYVYVHRAHDIYHAFGLRGLPKGGLPAKSDQMPHRCAADKEN